MSCRANATSTDTAEPPATETETTTATTTTPSASLSVIADPHLFRMIASFAFGWPGLVLQQWKELRWPPWASYGRGLYTPTTFIDELMRRHDLRALELAVHSIMVRANGVVESFQVNLKGAIQSGSVEMMQWAIAHATINSKSKTPLIATNDWREAILSYPGHNGVLDLLFSHAKRTKQPCPSDRLMGIRISCVPLLEWTIAHFGMPWVPPYLISQASEAGNLPLVQFVDTLPWTYDWYYYIPKAMEAAAKNGHLQVLEYLHSHHHHNVQCTTTAMNQAASSGHLDVVMYLHTHCTVGCSTEAMDQAAKNGHLQIVQYLHTNRHEGATAAAMDWATRRGHFEIVVFLHRYRTEGCTHKTMNAVAQKGKLALLKLLHEERSEGCTAAAMQYRAQKRVGCYAWQI